MPPELIGPDPNEGPARHVIARRSMPVDPAVHFPYGAGYTPAEELGLPPSPAQRRLTMRDLLIQAFYNARLIRICVLGGAILGLVGAGLARTQFTADALLMYVGPDISTSQGIAGGSTMGVAVDGLKAVQSEMEILQSDDVLARAAETAGPARLFPGLDGRRLLGLLGPADQEHQVAGAVRRIRAGLHVSNEAGTNVISVGFTNPDRAEALRVTGAVVDAYLDRRRQVYASSSTAFLGKEIKQYSDQLRDIEAKMQALRTRYGVLDITQDITLASNRLDGVLQRENQVRERRATVHAELIAAQDARKNTPQQVFDSRESSNNAPNDDARNTLLRLEQERSHMEEQYSPTWPALKELDAKIAAARAQINDNAHTNFFTARAIRNPVVDQLNSRYAALQIEDQSLDKQLTELGTQYQQAQDRVNDLQAVDNQLHDLQRSRDVAEGIYRQLSTQQAGSQYQDSSVDSRNASMRVVQPPSALPFGHSMALTLLAAGLMLGVVVAAAACVVATLMRQVYIMPSEAERDLELPSLAVFDVDASAFNTPQGRREIGNLAALMLDVTIDGRPLSLVQVVASSDADGKSALVRALATELAQGHGLRTLILDLHDDGRQEARALGGSSDRRLSKLESDVPVVATDVPQLWVSLDAARTTLGNARTLVARSREMLESLRQHFDMTLIIAPDDMQEYASRRLSGLVDANLLVVRSEHTRSPVAMQLRDLILSGGGNLLGFAYTWRKFYIPNSIYRWL